MERRKPTTICFFLPLPNTFQYNIIARFTAGTASLFCYASARICSMLSGTGFIISCTANYHLRPMHYSTAYSTQRLFYVVLFLFSLLWAPFAAAAEEPASALQADLKAWQETIDKAQEALEANFLYADTGSIATSLSRVLQKAKEAEASAEK